MLRSYDDGYYKHLHWKEYSKLSDLEYSYQFITGKIPLNFSGVTPDLYQYKRDQN